ncbi:rfrA family pentapeptide repeat [Crocosphaera subtropica ATCC 51142]|uniref:RfrA family pentapeptide repeat n=1 Tax=Crocosphaera subtropica (strain ATCC 51142 / BH68) TaxID=43989 RepID=B1WSI1_CROS5|nr:pentapeptide repeat-containing protein [Crocosphaera subtropica]ACB53560.1 rfrA family pentapeptide repeat [Crocosphaera subtropica ATCC 51142]
MFITTESFNYRGQKGEIIVWEKIKQVFDQRKCLIYWRYPIFSIGKNNRKEADILIADYELGLIIIEVKSLLIDQLVSIQGHSWNYQNFYIPSGNPYQQAETQLFSLLEYVNQEPSLYNKIAAKALVALPFITSQKWQLKGFHKIPSNPPILFQDNLLSLETIKRIIRQTPKIIKGQSINNYQWNLLLSILSGTPVLSTDSHQVLSKNNSKGKILKQLRKHLHQFDLQQEKIAKQIPPGFQRIRGVAGSGKTVLLCQKAAIMYLKNPQWKIAFIFFSRSLYEEIIEQIDQWIRYFSHQQKTYNKNSQQLQIFHAWGSREQLGFYRFLCQVTGVVPLGVHQTSFQQPSEALGEVCVNLLNQTAIPQIFDAILIDEGQDLMVNNWLYQGKQPFYWLAYQALRPIDAINTQQKRLIWTYDELQSLGSLKVPHPSEIFGKELGNIVTGKYDNDVNKTEVMSCCYRTPHSIIIAAHAMGMGWLRSQGILTGMTAQKDWKTLGYEIEGELKKGQKITIKRPLNNSPNPLYKAWKEPFIQFNKYLSRQQEISALSQQIYNNLRHDGLRPSKEILVLILGDYFESLKLQQAIANFLIRQGIDIYIPGSKNCNDFSQESEQNPNQFWYEGAITISRIYRAKGQEADMVYILGLDQIAKVENDLLLRNQLFVAMTRSRGWLTVSGIGQYSLYQELEKVLEQKDTFTITYTPPKQREIRVTEAAELLQRYQLGERNFQQAELSNMNLQKLNLEDINLIGANLSGTNLQNSNLNRAKLIAANLKNANLTGVSLVKAKLIGADLTNANLTDADLTNTDLTDVILNNTQGIMNYN